MELWFAFVYTSDCKSEKAKLTNGRSNERAEGLLGKKPHGLLTLILKYFWYLIWLLIGLKVIPLTCISSVMMIAFWMKVGRLIPSKQRWSFFNHKHVFILTVVGIMPHILISLCSSSSSCSCNSNNHRLVFHQHRLVHNKRYTNAPRNPWTPLLPSSLALSPSRSTAFYKLHSVVLHPSFRRWYYSTSVEHHLNRAASRRPLEQHATLRC